MSIIGSMFQKREENKLEKDKVLTRIAELKQSIILYTELNTAVSVMVYGKDTKDYLNELANRLSSEFKDWRSHALSSSTKKELVKNISLVLTRTVEYQDVELHKAEVGLNKILEREQQEVVSKERSSFLSQVYKFKDDYIRGFDSISEGVRSWDCLEALIEDGTVNKLNIADYGITL